MDDSQVSPNVNQLNAPQQAKSDTPKQQKRKFSSFFKSLVIELDKDVYGPDNHLVEVINKTLTN